MRETKYPLSLKVALVLLGIAFLICLFVIPSNSSPKNILPDVELPWNKTEGALVETLNKIYQYQGDKTAWALCETKVEGLYHMCLKDSGKIGPFRFIFSEGKLAGYLAEFPEMEYATLVSSAAANYPKGSDGVGGGFVKTQSREFRVYERDMKFGHLELYMVWDKDTLKVRVQAKYKHTGRQKKSEEIKLELDDGKAFMESDVIACLTFRPEPKGMKEALQPHMMAVLLKIICK